MARILVVDDEPVIRDLVRETLRFGTYDVSFASDGAAALEAASLAVPDLVLLDLCLDGDLDGLEVCRELTDRPRPPKVILITGHQASYAREACLEAGAAAYLTKPFSPLQLIAEIESLLEPVDG
jgi:CheY-like chemotaxis protein